MQITGLVLNNHKVSPKILPFERNIGEWGLLGDELESGLSFEASRVLLKQEICISEALGVLPKGEKRVGEPLGILPKGKKREWKALGVIPKQENRGCEYTPKN
ncbi:hypothetical protein [uncultured Draconibacterium sp.]|uniref:hypothetical protein n=1 Tax=uncultured Draconibacterium sp. TaxID=1573823 RepID=UPI0025FBF8E3|nr:hypothetical protein [uncultured Draconibacterium sp.]